MPFTVQRQRGASSGEENPGGGASHRTKHEVGGSDCRRTLDADAQPEDGAVAAGERRCPEAGEPDREEVLDREVRCRGLRGVDRAIARGGGQQAQDGRRTGSEDNPSELLLLLPPPLMLRGHRQHRARVAPPGRHFGARGSWARESVGARCGGPAPTKLAAFWSAGTRCEGCARFAGRQRFGCGGGTAAAGQKVPQHPYILKYITTSWTGNTNCYGIMILMTGYLAKNELNSTFSTNARTLLLLSSVSK